LTGGQLFFVVRYILHPEYNQQTMDHDVALIEVDVSQPTKTRENLDRIVKLF